MELLNILEQLQIEEAADGLPVDHILSQDTAVEEDKPNAFKMTNLDIVKMGKKENPEKLDVLMSDNVISNRQTLLSEERVISVSCFLKVFMVNRRRNWRDTWTFFG